MQNLVSTVRFIVHEGRKVSRTPNTVKAESRAQDKVPALTKAMAIVRYLNHAPLSGASLHDIANSLDITKSHCHNITRQPQPAASGPWRRRC